MTKNKIFLGDDFLLENQYSQELYHDYARDMPIIDYHNHLSPKDIMEDRIFGNLTEVWMDGDHYKWRAMRTLGVEERYITGGATAEEKFQKWGETVPYTMRNPLYHWTHMELSRYFGINNLLNKESAMGIYREATDKLGTREYSCRQLLTRMKVEVLCTTEDPIDDLKYHQAMAAGDCKVQVNTAFRPDRSLQIGKSGYNAYLDKLSEASGIPIEDYGQLCDALRSRIDHFHDCGCRLSDHGLEQLYTDSFSEPEIKKIFLKKRKGGWLSLEECRKFQNALLLFLAEAYHEKGWVQQFHLGALRNNNSRMDRMLGADTGWDSIGDYPQALGLSNFLDSMDSKEKLTKTILYNLNPSDNELMATMAGNFNDGTSKGKVQFGSSWWFLDQKDGMTKQLNALSNMGLIGCFVGMLTDSRSFLSFPRHEYFRRILCNLFGEEIQRGELPNDMEWIGKMVQDICYHNAKEYFNF